MMETTKQILSALAAVADGEVRDVRLWPGGYLAETVQEAAAEAAPHCQVTLRQFPDGSCLLSASVRPEHRSASRTVLGEFLNHAFLTSARQILNASPDVQ